VGERVLRVLDTADPGPAKRSVTVRWSSGQTFAERSANVRLTRAEQHPGAAGLVVRRTVGNSKTPSLSLRLRFRSVRCHYHVNPQPSFRFGKLGHPKVELAAQYLRCHAVRRKIYRRGYRVGAFRWPPGSDDQSRRDCRRLRRSLSDEGWRTLDTGAADCTRTGWDATTGWCRGEASQC